MDWLTHGIAAATGSLMTLSAAWLWLRGKSSSVNRQVASDKYAVGKLYRDEAQFNAIQVAKEYKEDLANLKEELAELQEKHLGCQRDGMLRDIQVQSLKDQVADLTKQVALLKVSLTEAIKERAVAR